MFDGFFGTVANKYFFQNRGYNQSKGLIEQL